MSIALRPCIDHIQMQAPAAEAFAVNLEGTLLAVGSNEHVLSSYATSDRKLDLQGQHILPVRFTYVYVNLNQ